MCLKCDDIDPMKTDAVKWTNSSLPNHSAAMGKSLNFVSNCTHVQFPAEMDFRPFNAAAIGARVGRRTLIARRWRMKTLP